MKLLRIASVTSCTVVASLIAGAQSMEIVSRAPGNLPANDASYLTPTVSSDGRFIVFNSWATNLVPGTNGAGDVFVLDRATQALELVTVNTGGPGGNGTAQVGGISDDGRYVAFLGNGLMPGDAGPDYFATDILIRDRQNGTTTELTGMEFQPLVKRAPTLSGDGQYVAWWYENSWFGSVQTVVVVYTRQGAFLGSKSGDSNGQLPALSVSTPILAAGGRYVVYGRRDANVRKVMRWEFAAPGSPEIAVVTLPATSVSALDAAAISRDGRFVVYSRTTGSGIVELWRYDVELGAEQRIDVPQVAGAPGWARDASISDEGRYVVFSSDATDLVAGDTNGVADVFVRDTLLQLTARVSVDLGGAAGDQASGFGVLDPTGSAVVFVTSATNLAPNDGNSFADVYRRSMCTILYTDGDGDGYGTGLSAFTCAPPLPNQSLQDGDCDDVDVLRHPNASESCNGIDDDCDGVVDEGIAGVGYCFGDGSGMACPCGNAGAADGGCANATDPTGAHIETLGCASLANDNVILVASRMPNGFALFFQGDALVPAGVAFGDGLLCVGGAFVRLGVKPILGGTARFPEPTDATLSTTGGVSSPGLRTFQAWYRDSAAYCTSSTFNLSHGLSVTWAP